MKAFILAGGEGTRLYPYNMVLPKPLMPIGEIPILEIILHQLGRSGFDDIILSVGYLESLLSAYFEPRRIPKGVSLGLVREMEPLGTTGSLSLLEETPTEPLLVMNGDILTNLDYRKLVEHHKQSNAMLTIATNKRTVKIDLGVLDLSDEGLITDYREKPELFYSCCMGIYVYDPKVFTYIEHGKRLDLPDLVLKLLDAGERVAAYRSDDLWLDIGSPEDHAQASEIFMANPEKFLDEEIIRNLPGARNKDTK